MSFQNQRSGNVMKYRMEICATIITMVTAALALFHQVQAQLEPGWLGVGAEQVNETLAERYRLESAGGAFVTVVRPGSPAHIAGISRGDIITSVDGLGVEHYQDLPAIVRKTRPGEIVDVMIVREGGRRLRVPVKVVSISGGR